MVVIYMNMVDMYPTITTVILNMKMWVFCNIN